MYWTNKKPTTDGFYWVKQTGELTGKIFSHIVHVYNKATTVYSDGENFSIDTDIFLKWSDEPIEEPKPEK
jgi:hypothetical protein